MLTYVCLRESFWGWDLGSVRSVSLGFEFCFLGLESLNQRLEVWLMVDTRCIDGINLKTQDLRRSIAVRDAKHRSVGKVRARDAREKGFVCWFASVSEQNIWNNCLVFLLSSHLKLHSLLFSASLIFVRNSDIYLFHLFHSMIRSHISTSSLHLLDLSNIVR